MAKVIIYTKDVCPYCVRAKNLFRSLNVPYEEINLQNNPALRMELSQRYQWRTVPMILVGDQFLGGFDDVKELHDEGKLRPLLADAA